MSKKTFTVEDFQRWGHMSKGNRGKTLTSEEARAMQAKRKDRQPKEQHEARHV